MQTRSKTDTFSLPTHRFDAAMFYSSSERQKLGRKSSKKHKKKTDSAKEPRSNIMVLSALKELGGVRRKAVSRQKIVSYVVERFTPGPRLLRAVKMTVRKLVGAGKVVQVSGAGANGSFRLPKPLPPDKTKVGRLLLLAENFRGLLGAPVKVWPSLLHNPPAYTQRAHWRI